MGSPRQFDLSGVRLSTGLAMRRASNSVMSSLSEPGSGFGTSIRHAYEHGDTTVTTLDASLGESTLDDITADSERFCESLLALSGEITLDEIVDIKRDVLTLHVYNLETVEGWYIANGIVTHNCRCVSAPAGINIMPPQAHIGKSDQEDKSRVAWLLIRARDEEGKWRYLLQQHNDGKWGMPGGTTHVDEEGLVAAYRETQEEIGDLPALTVVHDFTHMDPDGIQSFLFLCECNIFTPQMNGSTPEETLSTGWFRRGEIEDLDLIDKFRDDWEEEIHLREQLKNLNKTLQNMVNENGEWLVLDDPGRTGAGMGSRWVYPHHANGEEPGDAGPGGYPGMSPGGNPPHFDDNFADTTNPRIYPDGMEEEFPDERGVPVPRRRRTPRGGFPEGPQDPGERPEISRVGGNTGVPPSGEKNDSGHPVVGAYQPQTPAPVTPHPAEPQTYDPADAVEELTPEGNVSSSPSKPLKKASRKPDPDADLANPAKPGGASDFTDANPVDAEHVYVQLAGNFPAEAIEWVRRARWTGPQWVPWNRVDTDNEDEWAASRQPGKVNEFVRQIKEHGGHVAPSILVQEPHSPKGFIVDGHHRAVARQKLKQDVLAYVGNIDPKDRMAALETHTKQTHQGSDPANR